MIIFNHLAKCGGSSVTDLLRARFGDRYRICHPVNWSQIWLDLHGNEIDCISGHFLSPPEAMAQEFLSGRHFLFTLMRDPVSRFNSVYFYSKFNNQRMHQDAETRALNINDIYQYQIFPFYTRNSQVERICLLDTPPDSTLMTQERFNFALSRYNLIGAVEQMNYFVDKLKEFDIVPADAEIPHSNESTKTDERLTEANLIDLMHKTRLDRQLHELVMQNGVLYRPAKVAAQ
ncbi:sulfotransferase family 2 domain-containing protein [Radicibacter daui]|uniref:sulfotransferase family 2 domain-containing protein n=1 Tax=Radicibacter daui TaxID=3064829 RepID=UPI004046DA32